MLADEFAFSLADPVGGVSRELPGLVVAVRARPAVPPCRQRHPGQRCVVGLGQVARLEPRCLRCASALGEGEVGEVIIDLHVGRDVEPVVVPVADSQRLGAPRMVPEQVMGLVDENGTGFFD